MLEQPPGAERLDGLGASLAVSRDTLIAGAPGSAAPVVMFDHYDVVTGNPPRQGELPQVDVTRDVNADGRDDLIVPDADGFRMFIQTEGGAFADPIAIGAATDMGGNAGLIAPDAPRAAATGSHRAVGRLGSSRMLGLRRYRTTQRFIR